MNIEVTMPKMHFLAKIIHSVGALYKLLDHVHDYIRLQNLPLTQHR